MPLLTKLYAAVLGLLLFALFVVTVASAGPLVNGHHVPDDLGGFWWVAVGVLIGLAGGFALALAATRPWRWHPRVQRTYTGQAEVVLRRWWSDVRVARLSATDDDFDEQLHAALAEARGKAAAMNVAGQRS